MKKILTHKWFIVSLLLAAVVRFLYIQDGVIPFGFDHGKDALAVLHMMVTAKLKFIGPWTSIQGLYFGPAWYYLLLPFYYFGQFNPYWTAVFMSMLVLFQMYLAYRHFNIQSAILIGFTSYWITISRSAWNPFPMTLLTLIILILLRKQISEKKLNTRLVFGLFFTAAFGFHFSSAFAIFYPIIIVAVLLFFRFKPSMKALLASATGFFLPFIPQLMFEIKNNFIETKAVLAYFSKGESDAFGFEKIKHVLNTTIGEFRLLIFELPGQYKEYSLMVFIALLIVALFFIKKKNKVSVELKQLLIISLFFIIIPVIGFFFLHFNVWYVLPMIPVITVLMGTIFQRSPKWLSSIAMVIFIASVFFRLSYYLEVEKEVFVSDSAHLPVKKDVVSYIRSDAGDRFFSVYSYLPDIYDFQYQYLFLTQGLSGQELPMEFAYEPGVVSYVREKEDILKVIDSRYGERWRGSPEVIYFVISDDSESELLGNWWGRQRYGEITAEKKFGEKTSVYVATPEK